MEGFSWPIWPIGVGSLLEIKWDWENRAGVGCHPQACPWGPTLIVAPTSVCMNWVSGSTSPYPQYRSIWWERSPTTTQQHNRLICWYAATVCCSRKKCPKCCPRCSGKRLCWTKQAIKNMTTKRSQAAMNLKGGFKLITTGTPIENHLNCGICSALSILGFWVHLKASINALLSQLRSFRINRYAAN